MVLLAPENGTASPAPTEATYTSLGVAGITAENLAEVNGAIGGLTGSDVDTADEIQAIVDAVNAGNVIEAYADDSDSNPAPTEAMYATLGVIGVTAENLAEINPAIDGRTRLEVDTVAEIQLIVDVVLTSQEITNADADADGLSDAAEGTGDTDLDSVPDYLDLDSDDDGVPDRTEGLQDTDNDGIPNFQDLDSDNDGIFDLYEARDDLQEATDTLDTDGDGVMDASVSRGLNGFADQLETSDDSGVQNFEITDFDKDGVPDIHDLDTDNDGLFDSIEVGTNAVDSSTSSTGSFNDMGGSDGGSAPIDTDEDGLADYRDSDSDNDGIIDLVELFGLGLDLDGDGKLDDFIDANNDGVDDSWVLLGNTPNDTDNDGNLDSVDLDSDGDGISDLLESFGTDLDGSGTIDEFVDANNNGIDDSFEALTPSAVDSDGDGLPDFQDTDSDNDGISDLIEVGGVDADGDGRADTPFLGAALPDVNGDGTPDYLEGLEEFVVTGSRGHGCSIGQESENRKDPFLLLLLLFSAVHFIVRRMRSARPDKKLPGSFSALGVLITSVALTSCSTTGTVAISDSLTSKDVKPYVFAGAGVSRLQPNTGNAPSYNITDSVSGGSQLTLGADIHNRVSAQISTTDLGSATLSSGDKIDYRISDASVLLHGGRGNANLFGFSAFGRIGLGHMSNSSDGVSIRSANSTHTLLGAGVEYMWLNGLGARLEGTIFDEDARFLQLGIVYRTKSVDNLVDEREKSQKTAAK